MKLPAPIEAYFAADLAPVSDALTDGFARDAIVTDEGARHVGHAQIKAWRLAAKAKYPDVVSEPFEQITDGSRIVVRCNVSGDFPNSPVVLDFAFTVVGAEISALEIH